ncbi:hypothetical protein D3C84_1226960 [compost metagenome]
MLGARAIQASQIELGNQAVVMNADLALRIRHLERQVKAYAAERAAPESQQLAPIG